MDKSVSYKMLLAFNAGRRAKSNGWFNTCPYVDAGSIRLFHAGYDGEEIDAVIEKEQSLERKAQEGVKQRGTGGKQ